MNCNVLPQTIMLTFTFGTKRNR